LEQETRVQLQQLVADEIEFMQQVKQIADDVTRERQKLHSEHYHELQRQQTNTAHSRVKYLKRVSERVKRGQESIVSRYHNPEQYKQACTRLQSFHQQASTLVRQSLEKQQESMRQRLDNTYHDKRSVLVHKYDEMLQQLFKKRQLRAQQILHASEVVSKHTIRHFRGQLVAYEDKLMTELSESHVSESKIQ
jgi:hypothetical protein